MAILKINRNRRIGIAWATVFAALVMCLWQPSHAQNKNPAFNEYQIKAVFLFNFGQFVEWTASGAVDATAPFVIGVLGDDPFDGFLDEIVRGETIGKRPIVVRRYRKSEEISHCNILFIADSEANRLKQILAELRGRDILTVSDTEDFAIHGGIVQFVMEKKRIQLKINVNAAKAANLMISSKLLRPATIVASDNG